MQEGNSQRSTWILPFMLVTLCCISTLVYFVYQRGTTRGIEQDQATTTAIQGTADTLNDKHVGTAIAVGVHATATAQAPLHLTEVATQVQASQVAYSATQSSLEGSILATRVAEDTARNQQRYATESVIHATATVKARQDTATQVAVRVEGTVAALPTSTLIPTNSPPKPQINLLMTGCDTSLPSQIRGETTNVYVFVENVGEVDVSKVIVVAKASDEEAQHPDRYKEIQYLRVGHAKLLKLGVDTKLFQQSSVTVSLYTKEGAHEVTYRSECPEISSEELQDLANLLGSALPRGRFGKLLEASILLVAP